MTAAQIRDTERHQLRRGEIIDGIGGYATYGLAEEYQTARRLNLLPIGLAESCQLKCDVPIDQVLSYADVEVPSGSLSHALRREQDALFPMDAHGRAPLRARAAPARRIRHRRNRPAREGDR
jgi:predicted homoserine dehydrogenase-like protein